MLKLLHNLTLLYKLKSPKSTFIKVAEDVTLLLFPSRVIVPFIPSVPKLKLPLTKNKGSLFSFVPLLIVTFSEDVNTTF